MLSFTTALGLPHGQKWILFSPVALYRGEVSAFNR